jgi:outer membrane receptor protein involved in Fe transport
LQEGANVQYTRAHRLGGTIASFVAGGNFHDNQIKVGLYGREGRTPTDTVTQANAHVTNEAGYAQESLNLWRGKLGLTGGLRYDEFRYDVRAQGLQYAGRWQAKGGAAFTPSAHLPVTLHANYGRGINSVDARGVVQHPEQTRLATTDFYQVGASSSAGRVAVSVDAFRIDHSNEQVYIPDDGSFEFKGASRAYGMEAKASVALTRKVSLSGGLTKISNSYFRGGDHRTYVDSAPHLTANAALTVAAWRGWSGSLRTRAINHYRLDGEDAAIVAQGSTVFDFGVTRRLNHRVDLNFTADNALNRSYYETQNFFASRVSPEAPVVERIHGTPGYPVNAVAGITLHFGGK